MKNAVCFLSSMFLLGMFALTSAHSPFTFPDIIPQAAEEAPLTNVEKVYQRRYKGLSRLAEAEVVHMSPSLSAQMAQQDAKRLGWDTAKIREQAEIERARQAVSSRFYVVVTPDRDKHVLVLKESKGRTIPLLRVNGTVYRPTIVKPLTRNELPAVLEKAFNRDLLRFGVIYQLDFPVSLADQMKWEIELNYPLYSLNLAISY